MLHIYLILLCGLLANASPQKKGLQKELTLLWRQPFNHNRFTGTSLLYAGETGVLFTQYTDVDESESMCMLDAETGKLSWTWNDYDAHPSTILHCGQQKQVISYPYLFFTSGIGAYTLHVQSGETIMRNPHSFSKAYTQLGNQVLCIQNCAADGIAQVTLVDLLTGTQTPVYKMQAAEQEVLECTAPNCSFADNGDTLVYWMLKRHQIPENQEQNALYGYNLTRKRMIFIHSLVATANYTLVYQDLVIVASSTSVIAVNRQTGRLRWTYPNGGNSGQALQILGNALVFTDPIKGTLTALNPENGALRWETSVHGTCARPQELDGVIYTVNQDNGFLYAVDLQRGTLLWHLASPDLTNDPAAGFSFGLGLDKVRRRLYVGSFLAAYCYQLPLP